MVNPETLSIPDLRALATEYRRLADEIDSKIDAVLELANMRPGLIGETKRSKSPGIITGKWRDTLTRLATSVQERAFGVDQVIEAAKATTGRIMRAADVRRQFEPYLVAGYFSEPGRDLYKFTNDGFAKIGFTPDPALDLDIEQSSHRHHAAPAIRRAVIDEARPMRFAGGGEAVPRHAPLANHMRPIAEFRVAQDGKVEDIDVERLLGRSGNHGRFPPETN